MKNITTIPEEAPQKYKELIESLLKSYSDNTGVLQFILEMNNTIKEILIGKQENLDKGEPVGGMKADILTIKKAVKLSPAAEEDRIYTYEDLVKEVNKNLKDLITEKISEILKELKRKTPWKDKMTLLKDIIISIGIIISIIFNWIK